MKGRAIVLMALVLFGCAQHSAVQQVGELSLSSPAFENMGRIPREYTCDGRDVNPPLRFAGIPSDAASLALIVEDPDAPLGTFDHWIVWNIPVVDGIAEGSIPHGAVQGRNGFGNNSYGGPCPPRGSMHRYVFKLYALKTDLELPAGSTKSEVEKAMEGKVLAQTQLIGIYGR
jgi:Raf kinase inhibitor-like YbhB/YbcL family protein